MPLPLFLVKTNYFSFSPFSTSDIERVWKRSLFLARIRAAKKPHDEKMP